MTILSASKLDLAMQCLHWTTVKLPTDRYSDAAQFGSAFHELVDTGAHTQDFDEETDRLARVMFDGWKQHGLPLLPKSLRHEVAYEVLPDGTARELGERIGRDYGLIGGIPGTVDVVGEGRVIDFKTGRKYVTAAESWQLRFASVASGALTTEMHYVSKQTGRVTVDAVTRTLSEVAADRARLVVLMDDLRAKRAPANAGPHCDNHFCRARPKCAAYQAHLQQSKEIPVSKMQLSNVKKGRLETPLCVVLYATEGVGKSTFAADAPKPIFLGAEDGTAHLDIARFPVPATWEECLEALDVLRSETHDYKSVVIDTADWIEPLIHDFVCREGGKKSIEEFSYGKGFSAALDYWRELTKKLDALRANGMNVIVLAHAQVKTFRNPVGDDYDRYELKLHGKASSLLKEWANAVLFANYKTYTREKEGRVRAIGDGSRVVFTEHRPAWDAKNRYGLPYELPLSWAEFEQAARVGEPASTEKLLPEIEALQALASPEIQARAKAGIAKANGDARTLAKLADWLRSKVNEQAAA